MECTWWWFRKLGGISGRRIFEHSHVMNRSRPTSKYKGKPHVEVTNRHYILRCLALAVNVLSELISWDDNLYMSAINCTYAIVEM